MATIKLMRINMVWINYTFAAFVSTPVCKLPNHNSAGTVLSRFGAKNANVQARQPPDFSVSFRAMNRNSVRQFRTLLVLGRVSNLPTVWSNCLAGWWLGGGGNFWKLPLLILGTSALYIGGMFLNDAFDADFDRQRRAVTADSVRRNFTGGGLALELGPGWRWGAVRCCSSEKSTGVLRCRCWRASSIYDATHKFITASPWLMGLCRFWVYVIAGSTGATGLNGWPIWCGVALAFYVVGLSYVARRENFRGPIPYWPLLLLAAPIVSGHADEHGRRAQGRHAGFAGFGAVDRALRADRFFSRAKPMSGASCPVCWRELFLWTGWRSRRRFPHPLSAVVFLALFGMTMLLQHFVPAT